MEHTDVETAFDAGDFLKTLTSRPGIYRMFDTQGQVLYVGKARNLKKRVSSYFRSSGLAPKTRALMKQMARVEVTVTSTEAEALLLENNLIKLHKPRYNILLRDDKSYPYIYISTDDEYPGLTFHRGARKGKGRYFGPYPGSGAVRESLHLLQKMFRVRQCEDSFFSNRSRPCLQYQIKRCTAPCVGLVSAEDYAEDVRHTILFLEGKSTVLNTELAKKMEAAASRLDYEQAAVFRDQIASLSRVQERQYVSGESGDMDIVAAAVSAGQACVQVFFVRHGVNLGNKVFFPRTPQDSSEQEVLSAFVAQYYLEHPVPGRILLSAELDDVALLTEALSEHAKHRVELSSRIRGERARWLKMGKENAAQALTARLGSQAGMQQRLHLLQQMLDLDEVPRRIECFDISHSQGEGTVASCVVFDQEGPRKSDYRRFNISDITPGDDYAAMEQALLRRYTRLKKEDALLPELLLIDGGKGQVSSARKVMEELQITEILLVGVSKGPERRAGMEILHIPGQQRELDLAPDSPALHLVQQIRDEAHRFAITGHRQRRAKARNVSPLEGIPGVGPRRRQQLLKHFGGMQEVARAGVEDLGKVTGISRDLAQKIYDTFHG
ncbi:excinuclease ABC subunit C [Thiogranum longum]|uniref:UvrABC system protein C n=1 Tax=Thiogranum longum TaxID=1537524 RepID=A0A4R1HCZ9_9GAMM|nr:excinuclease ABC subunit UvrC [Thiogranum longum]TCK18155.1 excinuclease ABC subunit C [Thiogranum longum]